VGGRLWENLSGYGSFIVEMSCFRNASVLAFIAAAAWIVFGQEKEAKPDVKGLPPRVSPTDYQVQGKAGEYTIAAEFDGHAVPVEEGSPLSAEEYVVVEAAVYGPPGAKLTLSPNQFSLRINGKKQAQPSEPFEVVFKSLKDPEWIPPDTGDKKSKTSIGGGGGGGGLGDNSPPPTPHMPLELRRAMELKVRRGAFPEGDRTLPQAGLLFFSYRGKEKGISSVELIYQGPAGKATLNLTP